jgi:CBS domain-containing protein
MKVKDLMSRDAACCTPEQTVREAARLMEEQDCGCLPIADRETGRVLGVITDRDIAVRVVGQGRPADTQLRDVMSGSPSCCGPNDEVDEVEKVMTQRQVRRVPVIDDDGKAVGMVAQADLATHRGRLTDKEVAEVVARISKRTRKSRQEVDVGRQPSLH